MLDAGVWKEGAAYSRGDGVTLGGSFFIAQADTTAKPGKSDDWRLAVKRGTDGRDCPAGREARTRTGQVQIMHSIFEILEESTDRAGPT